jgi:hypothetical protein
MITTKGLLSPVCGSTCPNSWAWKRVAGWDGIIDVDEETGVYMAISPWERNKRAGIAATTSCDS